MFVKCSNLKLLTHSLSVHPHWVLGCSRSQHLFFFLFSLVLGLNTLPGVLAFCMAYAWLGELTRHTFLSHSLGLMSFFFFLWSLLSASSTLNILSLSMCVHCVYLSYVCVDLSSCVSVVYCVFTCSGTPKPLTLPSPPSPSCPFVLPPLIKMF